MPVATVEFGEAVTRKAVKDALGFDDGPVSAKLLSEARLYYRND